MSVPSPEPQALTDVLRIAELEHWDRVASAHLAEGSVSRCRRCGRQLRTIRARQAGIGPKCAKVERASGQLRMPIPEGFAA